MPIAPPRILMADVLEDHPIGIPPDCTKEDQRQIEWDRQRAYATTLGKIPQALGALYLELSETEVAELSLDAQRRVRAVWDHGPDNI